jgi:hypothetical protein
MVAASHRQKSDSDDEEKFDCDEHAHRFDLIRSSRGMVLLRASSRELVAALSARSIASGRTISILGDAWNIWADEGSIELASGAAQMLRARNTHAVATE